jgi:SulP family sulfate permease
LEARGITVLLKGARAEHLRTLRVVGAIDRLAHQRHLFDNLDDAIAHARLHVHRSATAPSNTSAEGT